MFNRASYSQLSASAHLCAFESTGSVGPMDTPKACGPFTAQIATKSLSGSKRGGRTAFVSRLRVLADLIERGMDVSFSAAITSCIYIHRDGQMPLRVCVRTPARRKKVQDNPNYDMLALVLPGGEIEYRPPLD